MNDEIHLLLAVALVAGLLRPDEPAPYLVAVAAAAVPMADKFTFTPLVNWGYLSGPVWVHRSVTHSLLAGALVVAAAAAVGLWRAGAIGYLAHLVPDMMFGGVQPLLPFDATVVAVYRVYNAPHMTAIEGTVSLACGLVIIAEVARQTRGTWPVVGWLRRRYPHLFGGRAGSGDGSEIDVL